ncbi:MAG: hypothetical protein EAZ53_03065 [Bacteroidetes bacterium]|nr:MAG: hypothetical protein EAZ53_03065 [Bacteroidota bacterium]
MSININNFNFIAAGGSQSISVTSNGIWTVSGLPAWLRANPATDFGNATTSIIATVNPNLGSRSCVITISSWSAMAFVTITQDGTLPLLVANPSILNYLSAASSQTLSITSNINWTISGLPVWLSVNTSSGFGNRNISLSTQLHSIVGIRTALITITGGALTQFVNITQTGAAANLVANPLTLTYPSAGNSQNISVTSNINWTIVSSQLWLTLSNPNGTNDGIISATASSNTATGIRIAQVTISGGSLTQIVNITQTGANPNVNVNSSTVNFTAAGGVQFVTISSNSNWNVSGIPTWMTVNPTNGTGNFVITLTAPINLNVNALNGIITVTSGLSSVEININQNGATPLLLANPLTLTYPSAGNSQNISVTSNINWTISGLPNWITLSTISGFGDKIVAANAVLNTSTGIRIAQLTVAGGAISRIINITQSGANPVLVANPLTLTYPSAGNSQNISVTSNMNWTSISSQPWLTLSNPNGTNDGIILASASFNLSTNNRIATVTVTSLNPIVNQIISITQTGSMPAPILAINKANITNCGGTGSITLTGSGGALPYEFSLDNFVNTSTSANASFVFSNLAAGTYTGYVRNSVSPFYGTSISGILITTPVTPNIVTITASDITNCGLVDGAINVQANQGTGILEYFIDNSWTTSSNANGLAAGLYQVSVRNQNSPACSVSGIGNININQPNTPSNLTVNQINSIQSCDGSLGNIVLSATFGMQADLRFSLDGVDWTNATGTFTGLAAGSNYKASVRNVNAIACSLAGNNFNTITTPSFPSISLVLRINQRSSYHFGNWWYRKFRV